MHGSKYSLGRDFSEDCEFFSSMQITEIPSKVLTYIQDMSQSAKILKAER